MPKLFRSVSITSYWLRIGNSPRIEKKECKQPKDARKKHSFRQSLIHFNSQSYKLKVEIYKANNNILYKYKYLSFNNLHWECLFFNSARRRNKTITVRKTLFTCGRRYSLDIRLAWTTGYISDLSMEEFCLNLLLW